MLIRLIDQAAAGFFPAYMIDRAATMALPRRIEVRALSAIGGRYDVLIDGACEHAVDFKRAAALLGVNQHALLYEYRGQPRWWC